MKIFKTKEDWEYHISVGFPGYAWWGILAIVIVLYDKVVLLSTLHEAIFIVAFVMFLFQGVFKFKHKRSDL